MDIGEFEFIDRIKKDCSERAFEGGLGIGDDCAVIPYREGMVYLVSKDLLVERVHFELEHIGFKDLGWKSVAVNLSDIAAMGGKPHYIFVGLSVPSSLSSADLSLFYGGIREALDTFGLFLLGGDTTASSRHFTVSITIIGSCPKDSVLYRHGASFGDNIYVTGTLGDAGAGFLLAREDVAVSDSVRSYLAMRHRRPSPRVEEMLYLSDRYNLTSAIDISDGLSMDLRHITEASNCGALVNLQSIPLSKELLSLSAYRDIRELSLSFGEDYETLFTTSEEITPDGIKEFRQRFAISLTRVGDITEGGLYTNDKGTIKPLSLKGYEHFL